MWMPNAVQCFSLEMFIIALMGYVWVQSGRNRKTETLSAFFRMCTALMFFLLIDIPVRLSDLNLVSWDHRLVFVLNALYIGLEALTLFEWFSYFLTVQGGEMLRTKARKIIATIPLDVLIILLIVSYWTKWLFYIDDAGTYVRGSLFVFQFLLPYSYFIVSMVSSFVSYKKHKDLRMLYIFLTALLIAVVSSILQVLYSGSFTHAGLCLAINLVYMEMYREEVKQLDKMRSMDVVNKQLIETNERLHESVQELEISIENEKQANNAKNDFLSRMSHDIRTPLNGILGIIEIDEKHPDDIAFLTDSRRKAKVAAEHLSSLVNDVLDMSKLSTGKYELAHEPFIMPTLITNAFSIVRERATKAGITLINENEDNGDSFDYPATYGSHLHITRILINIIGNGIKYNKKNGSVSVKLEHEPVGTTHMKYVITISDTGIGMSDAFIQKMFEPFSQERIDARSVFEGTGLGMTITKALVDKMGGSINVSSMVGEGSIFTIALTFEIAHTESLETEEKQEDISLFGVNILLVEDNDLNVEIAQALLEDAGAIVTVARDGQEAVNIFFEKPQGTFDVILMDCMMPVLDGYGATRAIRSLTEKNGTTIPIIAMTANAFADDVKKCLESGMNAHVSKPINMSVLKSTIAQYLRK